MAAQPRYSRHRLLPHGARSLQAHEGAGRRRHDGVRRQQEQHRQRQGASAYSAAKAAEIHLARCLAEEGGPHGIRVNSVLPDAVIQGSSIWSSEWKEARSKQYGVPVDQLNDFYRQRNILKVEILPEDLAEAIAFSGRATQRQDDRRRADGGWWRLERLCSVSWFGALSRARGCAILLNGLLIYRNRR
ncbi:MAG: SDR family oxidoreductase [Blastochloris sp.]|nr:SDR family oxidoreductase [Blastochloris sp.]